MRCDGLPDPTNLPQLNAYRYRWLETDNQTEPSMERLLHRAPELNQVHIFKCSLILRFKHLPLRFFFPTKRLLAI